MAKEEDKKEKPDSSAVANDNPDVVPEVKIDYLWKTLCDNVVLDPAPLLYGPAPDIEPENGGEDSLYLDDIMVLYGPPADYELPDDDKENEMDGDGIIE